MKRVIFAVLVVLLSGSIASATVSTGMDHRASPGSGLGSYAIIPSAHVDAMVLAAGVAETYTVPASAKFIYFSQTCARLYVNSNGTAAEPSTEVADGSGSVLNPSGRRVSAADTFSLISPTACIVTLKVFK